MAKWSREARKNYKEKRRLAKLAREAQAQVEEDGDEIQVISNPKVDMINHPPHYKSNGMEVIDVIDSFGLNFNLGTALAYILRAGRKAGCPLLEDLKKARWYLEREIVGLGDD